MQILALFLLAVSAGALPQPPDLSPSAPIPTSVNTTAPYMHEKRDDDGYDDDAGTPAVKFEDPPTIGNFDDHKCHGTHLGTKITINDVGCVKFTPTNKYLDFYFGDSGESLGAFSDDHCGSKKPMKIISPDADQRRICVSVADLGGTVLSVKFPNAEEKYYWAQG